MNHLSHSLPCRQMDGKLKESAILPTHSSVLSFHWIFFFNISGSICGIVNIRHHLKQKESLLNRIVVCSKKQGREVKRRASKEVPLSKDTSLLNWNCR